MEFSWRYILIYLSYTFFVYNNLPRVYFGPIIKRKILELVEHEQKSLKIAMYTFTDDCIARAILAAYRRNVHVECIFDRFTTMIPQGRGFFLRAKGISVMEFIPWDRRSLMHNKYFIFNRTRFDHESESGPCVITGSYNCTKNATYNNYENIVVISDPRVIEKFHDNFRKIKEDSEYLSKKLAKKKNRG